VSIETVPGCVGVKRYQRVASTSAQDGCGSPSSRVASRFGADRPKGRESMTSADEKESWSGAAAHERPGPTTSMAAASSASAVAFFL
jgi:hypothetical protein